MRGLSVRYEGSPAGNVQSLALHDVNLDMTRGEFVGAVPEGSMLECRGEVVKAGRSMVFVRGLMTVEGEAVLSFSAVLKKTAPRT